MRFSKVRNYTTWLYRFRLTREEQAAIVLVLILFFIGLTFRAVRSAELERPIDERLSALRVHN